MRRMSKVLRVSIPTVFCLIAGCAASDDGIASADAGYRELRHVVVDTLTAPDGYAVAEPRWISARASGDYVVVDDSDKALKLFAAGGGASNWVGRPGSGPGEFTTLLGGGALGDSVFGYDFNGTRLSVFDADGRFVRSMALFDPGFAMPASVVPVDDSLFLAVGFSLGASDRELVRLIDRQGRTIGTAHNRSSFFERGGPDLQQSSVPQADAAAGTIFAGIMGEDSIFAYDYAGERLGAGRLSHRDLPSLADFQQLIEGNGGRRMLDDGRTVTEGHAAVVRIVALDARHAIAQVMTLDYGGIGRLDRTAGGHFALLELDREAGEIRVADLLELEGALIGRGHQAALIARYLGEQYENIELASLTYQDSQLSARD